MHPSVKTLSKVTHLFSHSWLVKQACFPHECVCVDYFMALCVWRRTAIYWLNYSCVPVCCACVCVLTATQVCTSISMSPKGCRHVSDICLILVQWF